MARIEQELDERAIPRRIEREDGTELRLIARLSCGLPAGLLPYQRLIWLTRDILEVWLEHAGLEAASHNYASAASSGLGNVAKFKILEVFRTEADFLAQSYVNDDFAFLPTF
jgi:hypothetical protein